MQGLHDLAQAEAHELPLDCRDLDAVELVRSTAQLFAPLAEEDDVTLVEHFPAQSLSVHADPARLTQAVQNLLANALRHTPPGGVITVAVRGAGAAAGDSVEVIIGDDGSGIEPEHLEYVFDRFYRTDRSRSRDSGGAGLGLAIVRAIVEAHDGAVSAQSKGVGQGSVFTVRLPALLPTRIQE